jgi:1,4-alpha-glucan branching enzyme
VTIKANQDGSPRIPHNSKYKICIEGPNGEKKDRNSAWAAVQVQDPKTHLFDCVFWNPPLKYLWTNKAAVPIPE